MGVFFGAEMLSFVLAAAFALSAFGLAVPAPAENVLTANTTVTIVDPPTPASVLVKTESKVQLSMANAKGYVISLPEDVDALNDFLNAWNTVAPNLGMRHIPGIRSDVKGLGLTMAYLNGLDVAVADGVDVAFFFEDDARLFSSVRYPDDVNELLQNWPESSSVLLLGAHHLDADQPNHALKLTPVRKAYGTYAWAVRAKDIPSLRSVWSQSISVDKKKYGCDTAWWKLWESRPAVVATPLLVDHPPGGRSTTFGKARSTDDPYNAWMGHRDWWNYEPMPKGQKPNVL
eukprot:c32231_g1_i1.p1 GENE.c32231_g1_i1~~c32231_g1_i1.p1  ORF type:complete len:288 (-),score=36.91 c32231_g1_i1:39-902(-)